jgi:hypothetical protein
MWYQTLDNLVSEFVETSEVSNQVSSFEEQVRRKLALLLQNDEPYESRFRLRIRAKKTTIEAAILLHWYLPKYLEFEVHQELLGTIQRLDSESKAWCLELMESKYVCLYYLAPLLSPNDFFGNVVRTMKELVAEMTFEAGPRTRPKPTVRRRGYQDHGSLRPSHEWKEKSPMTDDEFRNSVEYLEAEWNLIRKSLPIMKLVTRKVG